MAYWLRAAIEAAAWNLADHECKAAYNRLLAIQAMLQQSQASQITSDWLRATAVEIEHNHGEVLHRLERRLHPEWLDDADNYDPDYRNNIEQARDRQMMSNGGPHIEVLDKLGVKIDRERGRVTRDGECYEHVKVDFDTTSAEWHWVRVAVKFWACGGATREQIEDGYPGKRNPQAMRQAKSRASKKLKPLDLELTDGYPVEIIAVTQA